MDKRDFISNFSISNAIPLDPSARSIPAEAFAGAIDEFLSDGFKGVVRVRTLDLPPKAIMVCSEYAAYFFKELLCAIYGRLFLEVTIGSADGGMAIDINFDEELPISEKEMRGLIKIARNAGMDISIRDRQIRLLLRYSDLMMHHVYAISVRDGRLAMLGKLREIFFCGEPYGEDSAEKATEKSSKTKKPTVYR